MNAPGWNLKFLGYVKELLDVREGIRARWRCATNKSKRKDGCYRSRDGLAKEALAQESRRNQR